MQILYKTITKMLYSVFYCLKNRFFMEQLTFFGEILKINCFFKMILNAFLYK